MISRTLLMTALAATLLWVAGCGGDYRYQLLAQNVAGNETIHGYVYRIDRKTGEVLLIDGIHATPVKVSP